MTEIIVGLISLFLGNLQKNKSEQNATMLQLAQMREASHQGAFSRAQADDAFTRWWRVPVRPIITYVGFGAFYALPFIAIFTTVPVHMEVCENVSGIWAWLTNSAGKHCEYVTLGSGITWTQGHTLVATSMAFYWFGNR